MRSKRVLHLPPEPSEAGATGLFAIQAEILRERRGARELKPRGGSQEHQRHGVLNGSAPSGCGNGSDVHGQSHADENHHGEFEPTPGEPSRDLTYCFLRLANLDSGAFGLLNRYEVALWRQTVQTIVALRAARRLW